MSGSSLEGVYSHPVDCLKGDGPFKWCLEYVLGISEGFYEGPNQGLPVLTIFEVRTLKKRSLSV